MAYLARRLAIFALTLVLISMVTFAITQVLPGDVAMMIMGTQSNPEALEGLRNSLGLNDPLLVQYWRWISGMLTGEWGVSLRFKEPIALLISQKATASAIQASGPLRALGRRRLGCPSCCTLTSATPLRAAAL